MSWDVEMKRFAYDLFILLALFVAVQTCIDVGVVKIGALVGVEPFSKTNIMSDDMYQTR